jgi:hypothetical protein
MKIKLMSRVTLFIYLFSSFLISSLQADNDKKETLNFPSLTIDINNVRKQSKFITFNTNTKVFQDYSVKEEETSSLKIDYNSTILLEVDCRDEESFSTSVLNAWELNEITASLLSLIDFRDYFKGILHISDIPNDIEFISFYKISADGICNWIVIHQAVAAGIINDDIFSLGSWICLPMQGTNNKLSINEARIVHITNPENKFTYADLNPLPDRLKNILRDSINNKSINKAEGSKDDPFSSVPSAKSDPFDPASKNAPLDNK